MGFLTFVGIIVVFGLLLAILPRPTLVITLLILAHKLGFVFVDPDPSIWEVLMVILAIFAAIAGFAWDLVNIKENLDSV